MIALPRFNADHLHLLTFGFFMWQEVSIISQQNYPEDHPKVLLKSFFSQKAKRIFAKSENLIFKK